jgi:hypothetical protein
LMVELLVGARSLDFTALRFVSLGMMAQGLGWARWRVSSVGWRRQAVLGRCAARREGLAELYARHGAKSGGVEQ